MNIMKKLKVLLGALSMLTLLSNYQWTAAPVTV
jgi:hypothetical protein